jgi:hypothetical protein
MKGMGALAAAGLVLTFGLNASAQDAAKNGAGSSGQTAVSVQRSCGERLQGQDRRMRVDCSQSRETEALLPRKAGEEEVGRFLGSVDARALARLRPGLRQATMTCATACPLDER